MTTVATIADEAFTAVSADITDVIKTSSLTKITQGTYNPSTGQYATTDVVYACRSIAGTATAIPDMFPDYVVGPSDALLYLEGLTVAPAENDTLDGRTIRAVGDIVEVGTFFAVIVRDAAPVGGVD